MKDPKSVADPCTNTNTTACGFINAQIKYGRRGPDLAVGREETSGVQYLDLVNL